MNHHELEAVRAAHMHAVTLTEHPNATPDQIAKARGLADEAAAELARHGAVA